MNVKKLKVIKDISLDDYIIKTGEIVRVAINDSGKQWTLFHHTGWWKISSEYFLKGVKNE